MSDHKAQHKDQHAWFYKYKYNYELTDADPTVTARPRPGRGLLPQSARPKRGQCRARVLVFEGAPQHRRRWRQVVLLRLQVPRPRKEEPQQGLRGNNLQRLPEVEVRGLLRESGLNLHTLVEGDREHVLRKVLRRGLQRLDSWGRLDDRRHLRGRHRHQAHCGWWGTNVQKMNEQVENYQCNDCQSLFLFIYHFILFFICLKVVFHIDTPELTYVFPFTVVSAENEHFVFGGRCAMTCYSTT